MRTGISLYLKNMSWKTVSTEQRFGVIVRDSFQDPTPGDCRVTVWKRRKYTTIRSRKKIGFQPQSSAGAFPLAKLGFMIFRSARTSCRTFDFRVRPPVRPRQFFWITYIQAYMPYESSEVSSNQPDGPMGSHRWPLDPLGPCRPTP